MFIISIRAYTQYTYSPNTVYMIPPTSGCNGEWAVLDSTYTSGSCSFPTYSTNPFFCATINHRNGDTLFLDLCSIPCDVTITSDSGNICLASSVDFATSVIEEKIVDTINVYPNPNNGSFTINIKDIENATIEIYNISGQLILKEALLESITPINLKENPKGIYFVKVETDNKAIVKKIFYQ